MLPSIKDASISGKRVILRADLNVPLNEDGTVLDKQRIVDVLPTINYILHSGAKQLIILSHHGRPGGKRVPKESLKGVWKYFRELAYDMHFVKDIFDKVPEQKLVLMENVRFYEGEEANDQAFIKHLATLGDIFVNDAFASYRAHASTSGISQKLPTYIGFLFQREIHALSTDNGKRPLVFLLGGSKPSTKLPLIETLAAKADHVLLGGALIHHFYVAKGFNMQKSKYDPAYVDDAQALLEKKNIHLPIDLVAATQATETAKTRVCPPNELKEGEMGLDIGPGTVKEFKKILKTAGTIIWNGPMGLYEIEKFAKNTDNLLKFMATLDAEVIAGGGDSITVLNKLGMYDQLSYVSTGGGATLEYLRTGTLPVITEMAKAKKLLKVKA